MSKPFIALYKAFRGGEWFGASLESIREHTDGAVVMFSAGPWSGDGNLPGNCYNPWTRFQEAHPEYPGEESIGQFATQEHQYRSGLAAVVDRFGPDAAVLIIDTDEIWDGEMLAALRREVEAHPEVHYFRSSIYTYLRSPHYRVWPQEGPNVCVALQDARPQPTPGRFATAAAGPTLRLPEIAYHHFPYVREDEKELRAKFDNTSSQETTASDSSWWDRVWPWLPHGHDLHMTPGCETCWGEVTPIVPDMLPEAVCNLPFVDRIAAVEDARWRDRLRTVVPEKALIPVPTEGDAGKYTRYLRSYFTGCPPEPGLLHARMKTTYLEALWLAHWASNVPTVGRILEIGCGSGGSTAVLAMASDSSVGIETVDPFLAYDEETHAGIARDVHEGNEDAFWGTARLFRYNHRVLHHDVSSLIVAERLLGDYDLIFVDGNHSAEFVRHDLMVTWQRLKPGCILVGHDYTTRFPGVIEQADAMDSTCNFRTPAGTSLFYARKPE